MCCIFTCCGWMIDLIQRVWTFAMSCCISSAICCVLVSSSLSGIALGYNYSLAEYIDLKETNVSVYLKRGVFDDEIADDMDWRRSGHLPVGGHINDENLITGAPEGEEQPLRSGRRLDDSVFESGGDHNKFEGSLMKLTAKPLDEPITPVTYTPDVAIQEVQSSYPAGSMERVKAIQEVLNKRRYDMTSTPGGRRWMNDIVKQNTPQENHPPTPNIWPDVMSERRFNNNDPSVAGVGDLLMNPARTAVPPRNIGDEGFWKIPYLATSTKGSIGLYDAMMPRELPTRPKPIIFNWGPIRPTTVKPTNTPEPGRVITVERIQDMDVAKSAEEFDKLDQKMGEQDKERARQKIFKERIGGGEEDYDVDPKGIPIRKKRRTVSTKFPDVFNTDSGRKIQDNDQDGKGFPNRYKRDIVSSSSSVPSFLDKLSRPSDVFNTKAVPKIYENDMNVQEIPIRQKRQINFSSNTILSTTDKLSKLSDVFNTDAVPKMYESAKNAKNIRIRKKRHTGIVSSTIPFTLGKLSKFSDVFLTETASKRYANNMNPKEILSTKKRQIASSSSSTFEELGKSSEVFNTETVFKIYENDKNAKETSGRDIRHFESSSNTFPTLSRSSDMFHTEILHENTMNSEIIPTKKKRKTDASSGTLSTIFGKLGRSSRIFYTQSVSDMITNDVDQGIPIRQKENFVSISSTFPELSKSSDIFHTETIYKKDLDGKYIPKRTESSTFGSIFAILDKLSSNPTSQMVSNSKTLPTIPGKEAKSSDLSHFQTADKQVSYLNFKGVPSSRDSEIISIPSIFSTTFGKLGRPDMFNIKTVHKEENVETKGILNSQDSDIVSSSSTFPTIYDKLSKSSDVFHTETALQQDSKLDTKVIPSKQNSQIYSSSTNPTDCGTLTKSTDIFRTKNLLNFKNNVDAKNSKIRKKRRLSSTSKFLYTTPSRLTSDVFNSEIMQKIHKTMFLGVN